MTLELEGLQKFIRIKLRWMMCLFHLHPAYMGFWDLMEPVNQL